jgi:hypothetical protein
VRDASITKMDAPPEAGHDDGATVVRTTLARI